jgi:hypothetical protein
MKRLLAGVILMTVLTVASCRSGSSTSDFERIWISVSASVDASEEARHIDELLAYVHKRSLQYEIIVLDVQTGKPFPITQLGSKSVRFAVRIRVEDRLVTPDWQPKNVANVQKLFME